jgi:HEPN domain-containing protein
LNTKDMAQDYINTTRSCLREAREASGEGNFSLCVRRAQKCIELSIKAVLRTLAIEFPKEHDVSDILQGLDGFELPDWFKKELPGLASIMRKITPKRGPALYGFERELKPPSEIFSRGDGEDAQRDAEEVYRKCNRFIEEWEGS